MAALVGCGAGVFESECLKVVLPKFRPGRCWWLNLDFCIISVRNSGFAFAVCDVCAMTSSQLLLLLTLTQTQGKTVCWVCAFCIVTPCRAALFLTLLPLRSSRSRKMRAAAPAAVTRSTVTAGQAQQFSTSQSLKRPGSQLGGTDYVTCVGQVAN